jgi:glutathione peroxidase-family protein
MSNEQISFKKITSIHELSETDANGNVMNLDFYKGRVCLIVNMTTKDENSLEMLRMITKLHRKYKDKG